MGMGARHTTHDGTRRWAVFIGVATALFILVWVGWSALSGRFVTSITSPLNDYSTMSVGLLDAPTSLDIRKDNEQASRILIGNVYETLTTRNESNAVRPGLVKSWKVSSDALTYTLTLRSNLRFSNGHVLDAEDVVWSLRSIISKGYAGSSSLSSLSSVTAVNDTTVTIRLSSPDPTLLRSLSGQAGIVYDQDASYNHSSTAVGSGPYTVTDFESGSRIVLRTNRDYWGSAAKTSQITVDYFSDDDALLDALEDNDIQAAFPSATVSSTRIGSLADVHVVSGATTSKVLLAFNFDTESMFSDLLVRQATRYLIDTSAIVKSRDDADSALGGPLSPLEPGYRDLTGLFPHNTAKAQSMLTYYGTSYLSNAVFLVPKSYSSLAKTIVGQLSANGRYGITTKVVADSRMSQALASGGFAMALVIENGTTDMGRYGSKDPVFQYQNSDAQKLYAQANTATSAAAYEKDMGALASTVSKDAAAAWLYAQKRLVVARDGVTGYPTNMTNERIDLADLSKS